jgi:esterase/lipase superfamily enzyme
MVTSRAKQKQVTRRYGQHLTFDLAAAVQASKAWQRAGAHGRKGGATALDTRSALQMLHRIERLSAASLQRGGAADPILAELRAALEQLIATAGARGRVATATIKPLLEAAWETQRSSFFDGARRAAMSVGCVVADHGHWSAVMVAPSLLLTSRHALPDVAALPEAAEAAKAQLLLHDYRGSGHVFDLDPTTFLAVDTELDVAIVGVAAVSRENFPLSAFSFSPLTADEGIATLGEPVNIIYCGPGGPTGPIVRGNRITDLPGRDDGHLLHYASDAAFIPAGAALFNDQWELVAIQRTGIPRLRNGVVIAKTGRKWSGDDPRDIAWLAQEAVSAAAIARLPLLAEPAAEAARATPAAPLPPDLPTGAALPAPTAPTISVTSPNLSAILGALVSAGAAPIDQGRRTVDLLYATKRQAATTDDGYFSGERVDNNTYGSASVHIPEAHRIGQVELPFKLELLSWTLYEQQLDPQKHFIIQNVDVRTVEAWRKLITDSGLHEALVFVHGFNNTFRDGLYRAAQIMWDLQYAGIPLFFSWPSRGRVLDYLYDRDSALGARDAFIEMLRNVRAAGVERIHVLAHSMGNLVVLDALANHQHTDDPLGIAEVLMAAPDVDRDHYRQIAAKVRLAAAGMTLYASSADRALQASKRIAGDIARAGDVPAQGPIVLNDIDSIDVTPIGAEIFGLGHGHYAQNRSVLNDIGLVIRSGARPPNARLVEIRGMPIGQQPPSWWRYAPA